MGASGMPPPPEVSPTPVPASPRADALTGPPGPPPPTRGPHGNGSASRPPPTRAHPPGRGDPAAPALRRLLPSGAAPVCPPQRKPPPRRAATPGGFKVPLGQARGDRVPPRPLPGAVLGERLEPGRVVWGDSGAGGGSSVLGGIGGIPRGGRRQGVDGGVFEQVIWILGLFRGRMWDPEGVRVWGPLGGVVRLLRGVWVCVLLRGVWM